MPKYDIEVELSGQNGNVFNLIAICKRAMSRNKVPKEEVDKFVEEATSGDYDHALGVMQEWLIVN